MAPATGEPAAGDEVVPVAGDVGARAPGRGWTERLAVRLKEAAVMAAVLVAVAAAAVAITKTPPPASVPRVLVTAAFTFLPRVFTALLAAGCLTIAAILAAAVTLTILIRFYGVDEVHRRFLPSPIGGFPADELGREEEDDYFNN